MERRQNKITFSSEQELEDAMRRAAIGAAQKKMRGRVSLQTKLSDEALAEVCVRLFREFGTIVKYMEEGMYTIGRIVDVAILALDFERDVRES